MKSLSKHNTVVDLIYFNCLENIEDKIGRLVTVRSFEVLYVVYCTASNNELNGKKNVEAFN